MAIGNTTGGAPIFETLIGSPHSAQPAPIIGPPDPVPVPPVEPPPPPVRDPPAAGPVRGGLSA